MPRVLQTDLPVAVVGLARSGLASVQALSQSGFTVLALDSNAQAVAKLADLNLPRVEVCCCANEEQITQITQHGIKQVVVSPGIPATGEFYAQAQLADLWLLSEVELAWQLRSPSAKKAKWVGVTGTNGKTTTTSLIAHIIRSAGYKATALGNIGVPIASMALAQEEEAPEVFVCELSSFQLHSTFSMSLDVSVYLNLDADHLDWHGSFEQYAKAKAQIFENTKLAAFYPVGDKRVQQLIQAAEVEEGARAIGITLETPQVGQIGIVDDLLVERAFFPQRYTQARELMTLPNLVHLTGGKIPGPHLVYDVLAACGVCLALGLSLTEIRAGVANFQLAAHRCEPVLLDERKVLWINDSKATNAHAALPSLVSQEIGKCVWIVGGLAKGAQFIDLVQQVIDRLSAVIVIGVDQTAWQTAISDVSIPNGVHYLSPSTNGKEVMRQAVKLADSLVPVQGSVLLAPACASMDQFLDYEARGRMFVQCVKELKQNGS